MNPLSLDKLTVWELTHTEMAFAAAELGYQSIGLFANSSHTAAPIFPPITDLRAKRELAGVLASTGITAHNIEYFALQPETDLNLFEPALEFGAELGARHATVLVFDDDNARALENFVRFAELAAAFRLNANVEFMSFSQVNSIGAAVNLIRSAAQPNTGIVVDVLHLMRTGRGIADLIETPPELVRYAQICDGPATIKPDQAFFEAVEQRLIPGAGGFPLREFLAALPEDVTVGIEVPLKDAKARGIGARDRAAMVDSGLRSLTRHRGR